MKKRNKGVTYYHNVYQRNLQITIMEEMVVITGNGFTPKVIVIDEKRNYETYLKVTTDRFDHKFKVLSSKLSKLAKVIAREISTMHVPVVMINKEVYKPIVLKPISFIIKIDSFHSLDHFKTLIDDLTPKTNINGNGVSIIISDVEFLDDDIPKSKVKDYNSYINQLSKLIKGDDNELAENIAMLAATIGDWEYMRSLSDEHQEIVHSDSDI